MRRIHPFTAARAPSKKHHTKKLPMWEVFNFSVISVNQSQSMINVFSIGVLGERRIDQTSFVLFHVDRES